MTWCLKILFVNVLVHAFFALYASLLNTTRLVSTVSRLVALSVALNVGLNLVFLPQFGAMAAAWNTLVCAGLVSVCYVWLVQRRAGVPVPWVTLARLLGVLGGLSAGWYGLQRFLHLGWLSETVLAGLLFVGLVLALGVVRPAELRQLRGMRRGGKE